jgi:hypothetical protein
MASLFKDTNALSGTPSNRSPSHTTIQTYGFPHPPPAFDDSGELSGEKSQGVPGKTPEIVGLSMDRADDAGRVDRPPTAPQHPKAFVHHLLRIAFNVLRNLITNHVVERTE